MRETYRGVGCASGNMSHPSHACGNVHSLTCACSSLMPKMMFRAPTRRTGWLTGPARSATPLTPDTAPTGIFRSAESLNRVKALLPAEAGSRVTLVQVRGCCVSLP